MKGGSGSGRDKERKGLASLCAPEVFGLIGDRFSSKFYLSIAPAPSLSRSTISNRCSRQDFELFDSSQEARTLTTTEPLATARREATKGDTDAAVDRRARTGARAEARRALAAALLLEEVTGDAMRTAEAEGRTEHAEAIMVGAFGRGGKGELLARKRVDKS